jgi:16S rRNA (cytidine1402-2'-O)-methyltransferase
VVSVPGPSALVSALSIAGVPADRFIFLGFLKKKSSKRRKELEKYKNEDNVIVFFESPFRIMDALQDIKEVFNSAYIIIAREMTKKFEEVVRGPVDEVTAYFAEKKILGEFCVIIKPDVNSKGANLSS